jgi:hypothetical protein
MKKKTICSSPHTPALLLSGLGTLMKRSKGHGYGQVVVVPTPIGQMANQTTRGLQVGQQTVPSCHQVGIGEIENVVTPIHIYVCQVQSSLQRYRQ